LQGKGGDVYQTESKVVTPVIGRLKYFFNGTNPAEVEAWKRRCVMRRMIMALLIATALLVTCAPAPAVEMVKPLKAGMPNTITLANGQIVYDLNGDWDITYDDKDFGISKSGVRITQEGDQFVGKSLTTYREEMKGTLEKNGFKKVYSNIYNTFNTDWNWLPAKGEISEDGNKIIIKTWQTGVSIPYEQVRTLQRK
jgi:hypothetical protein